MVPSSPPLRGPLTLTPQPFPPAAVSLPGAPASLASPPPCRRLPVPALPHSLASVPSRRPSCFPPPGRLVGRCRRCQTFGAKLVASLLLTLRRRLVVGWLFPRLVEAPPQVSAAITVDLPLPLPPSSVPTTPPARHRHAPNGFPRLLLGQNTSKQHRGDETEGVWWRGRGGRRRRKTQGVRVA